MNADRWRRLEALFDQARTLSPDDRSRFLDEACAGDAAMRAEVERLLSANDRAGDFISAPAINHIAGAGHDHDSMIGRAFGPYRVESEIARGGMGAVYLAQRADGEFEQRAALKVIKRGMDTDLVLKRFRAERQILATLEHPNIARLLDGGSTEDGRPYFLMEYIEGQSIDDFAEARKLGVRDRLALFLSVCDAVQYAHQHLIVHRDIKPGNILVTPEGVPKLLDFGIAKALDPDDDAPTGTITGARIMTPEYASPEQIEGRQATVTSDVYSLGVVLYRLLTGGSPYRLTSRDPIMIAEAVRTTEPSKPSMAVEQVPRLRQALRGDLDTIVLMALRKEPERRYRSVRELADDIRRHLAGEPVRARSDGVGYRVSKFVQRHRTPVVASVVTAGVLALGLGIAAWRWPRATTHTGALAPRDRVLVADFADHTGDSTLAAAVSDAVRVDLTQSSFVQLLSAREIRSGLARMARSPDVALDDSLARELAVREGVKAFVTGAVSRVGKQYTLLAQLIGAEKGNLLAATRETATDSDDVIPAIGRLSASLRERMGESLRNIDASPSLDQVTTPSLAALRLYTAANRAGRAGFRDSSNKLLLRAIALDTGFASAYRLLGYSYSDAAEPGRGHSYLIHAIANQQRMPFYERNLTIASYAFNYLNDYPAAIAAYNHILERYPNDVPSLNNIGFVYAAQRRFVEQESALVRAIRSDSSIKSVHMALAMAAVNNGDYRLALDRINWVAARDSTFSNLRLARIYYYASQQDWETAERMARIRIAASQKDSFDLVDAYETLAGIVMTRGRLREGERHSRSAMTIAKRVGSPGRFMTSAVKIALLDLRVRNDTAAAIHELEQALAAFPTDSVLEADRHYDDFARAFAAAGKTARARQLVARAAASPLDSVLKVNPDRHWSRGAIALAEHQAKDAVAELREASATHPCTICVLPDLARAYIAAEQPDSARAVYERYLALPWEWRFETDDTEIGPALAELSALYRQFGDSTHAQAAMSKLRNLWRNGDPEAAAMLSRATTGYSVLPRPVEIFDDDLRNAADAVLRFGVRSFDRVREECDDDRP
jgi:serine/threonine protein kinase/tetratricopeptide (TPR) repeat protein